MIKNCNSWINVLPDRSQIAFTFDDVSLIGNYTEVVSRLTVQDPPENTFLTTNMLNISGNDMCNLTHTHPGWNTILHRFHKTEAEFLKSILSLIHTQGKTNFPIVSLGIKDTDDSISRVDSLCKVIAEPKVLIDIAYGNSKACLDLVKIIKRDFPQCVVYLGNFFGGSEIDKAIQTGVNGVRIGIGAGQKCLTRLETGMGFPMLSAIAETANFVHRTKIKDFAIIADGGIKSPSDAMKCLAFGATSVCMGSIFDGTDCTPGEWKRDWRLRKYKYYYGMSSHHHIQSHHGHIREGISSEGLVKKVYYQGLSKDVIDRFLNGYRSSLSYAGTDNLLDYKKKVNFIFMSPASAKESYHR